MPCGDGAFALSETFGQSLFGESRTAFCFYWFASVKANFTRLFPHFFTNIPQEKSNLLGSANLGVGEELRQAMNAQIRALTGGDITKEAAILQMDCWRALTELDAKAQEAQELRNQLK